MHTKPAKPVYATIAGFCLIAIGLCLTRYAYTPLIPSLIDAKWVTKPGAGYLGAFNCLGYIISCLIAIWMPRLTGVRLLMRLALVLAVVGLAMCAWDSGFIWLALGRFMAGLGGAVLVIHTPAVMLQGIGDRAKGICSGIAFSGAGITIILVSLLLDAGMVVAQSPDESLLDGLRQRGLFELARHHCQQRLEDSGEGTRQQVKWTVQLMRTLAAEARQVGQQQRDTLWDQAGEVADSFRASA